MEVSQRDIVANYLFQFFIEGVDCSKPPSVPDQAPYMLPVSQAYLSRRSFEEQPPSDQEAFITSRTRCLNGILHCSNAEHLLEELSPKVGEVYRRKSRTLRPYLDILIQRRVFKDPDVRDPSTQMGGPMDKLVTERAWHQKYQGTAHETLLQNIRSSYKPVAYANSGAIIQSSGYGKSRTVDQMAMLIPTIPMNVRFKDEEKQGAFPPADTALIDIFDIAINSSKPLETLFVFFKLLFELVRDLAKDFGRDNFTTALHHYFEDHDKRSKLYADLSEKLAQDSDEPSASSAIQACDDLMTLFPKSEENVKPMLVIYIDEAHTLASKISDGKSMYDHVLKATAELATAPIFFLFLSTASRLEILARHPGIPFSARFEAARTDLVAPFTEMPFDCHPSLAKEPIRSGLKLEDIQQFSFVVQFGRPLFWAYYEAMIQGGKNRRSAHSSTIALAQAKLVSSTSTTTPLGNTGKLAILDTLLNLEYDPQRTHSHQLASKMVAGHLRTVYAVPLSRAYMYTGYPSEPVLAEAALSFVHYSPSKPDLGPLLSLFRDLDDSTAGAIDRGERGENVGKMILLLAYLDAVSKHQGPIAGQQLWAEGCSLIDFLEELTGAEFTEAVLDAVPDNVQGGATLREKFKNSWVRFTHFARAADDSSMTSSMAWVAFIRGMAMIGWHSQPVVDVCIPILLDKDKPIEEANMTAILIRFKVREHATSRSKVSVWEEKIKYFPPLNSSRDPFATSDAPEDVKLLYQTRPYISLAMELGLVDTSNSASIPPHVVDFLDKHGNYKSPPTPHHNQNVNFSVSNVHASTPSTRRGQRNRPTPSDPVHPRYSLFYYGCSHKVYRCIPDTDAAKEACKALLQIPYVFNDRAKDRPIDPILQLKPFWNAGSNCFSWIDEPYLKPTAQRKDLGTEEVLIGDVEMGDPVDDSVPDDAMDEDP